MKLAAILAAALCLTAGSAFAQAPQGADKDAAKAEMRQKMKGAYDQAQKTCQGKTGPEHRECMRHEMCAQAKDPKACEERAEKMKGEVREAREACKGKSGAEHDQCMVQQMCADAKDKAACETRGKQRIARREEIREACKGKQGDDLKACIREHAGKK